MVKRWCVTDGVYIMYFNIESVQQSILQCGQGRGVGEGTIIGLSGQRTNQGQQRSPKTDLLYSLIMEKIFYL